MLNEPIYLNNLTHLINYTDLNKDITNTNIFRYISQEIYDMYDSMLNPNYTNESYVNLGDPSLNYNLNKNIEDIKDNIDPKRLEEMISENPDLKDSIKKMLDNPDFLKEQLLNISPYKGEFIDNVLIS